MNNEPVAIVELGGEITWLTDVLPYKAKLYTHPVKEDEGKVCAMCGAIAYDPVITQTVKELSRMDVYELAIKSGFMLSTQYGEAEHKLMPVSDGDTLVKLTKAILRKASE